MDFIIELLKSTAFDVVTMVIDLVFKRIHFVSIYMTVTVESAAKLFLHNVWKLHGLSTHIILNKELQFVAHFNKKLYYLLNIKIISSIHWHLQLDRQIKHVNQELD